VTQWAIASFGEAGALQAIFDRHYAPDRAAADRAALVPGLGVLVERFPNDWALPSLPRLLDAAEIAPLLPQVRAEGNGHPPCACSDVEILRYRPHNACVLAYLGSSKQPDRNDVVGKVYSRGANAVAAFERLSQLHAQDAKLIAAPIAALAPLSVLLSERVGGTSIEQLMKAAGSAHRQELVEVAAAALARLHTLRFDARQVRTLASELASLRSRIALLALAAPALARRMEQIRAEIACRCSRVLLRETCFIHGKYEPCRILVRGDRVALVDMDASSVGDPAVDVGNFMAQLCEASLHVGQADLRPLACEFLLAYERKAGSRDLAKRASLLQGAALVRMAVSGFFREPYAYARNVESSLPVRLLEEASRCLMS
jgi:aminoglycoside phosphotransferase (APT) family kinase protein